MFTPLVLYREKGERESKSKFIKHLQTCPEKNLIFFVTTYPPVSLNIFFHFLAVTSNLI